MGKMNLQDSVNDMIDQLDRKCFRKIMKQGFNCSADCTDRKDLGLEQIQQCIQRCQEPMSQVQNALNQELNGLQNRIQRCGMDCQDRARDAMGTNPAALSESKKNQIEAEMMKCIERCEQTHIALLPSIQQRFEQSLKQ